MVRTSDGFEIAEVDLELRGPGDITGTQQSGVLELNIADLVKDTAILSFARKIALQVLEEDHDLARPSNALIAKRLREIQRSRPNWGRIS